MNLNKVIGEVNAPKYIYADFAMIQQGDSMINARIFDGDMVFIRQTEDVRSGDLACVILDESRSVSLWRIWKHDDHIVLEPENTQYQTLTFYGEKMEDVMVVGKAVSFIGSIERKRRKK